MNEDEAIETRLRALLRGAERGPDEAFVGRVERAVAAERRMEAQRSAAWRRFAAEAAASIAVVIAFALLGRARPAPEELELLASSPLGAAGLLLILWMVVAFRPSGAAAR
jgi:hypothetical protein